MKLKIIGVIIYKEKAGVISEDPIWICFHDIYMYEAPTLLKLIWKLLTEWKHERNIVG